VAFVALHGTWGEDGTIQSILEKRGVPFSASGSEACRVAFDKVAAKKIFRGAGLATPAEVVLRGRETIPSSDRFAFGFPRVVKPAREGSSVGVAIVKDAAAMEQAVAAAWKLDDLVLIEEFIAGREMTVGVLGDEALPVVEIHPKNGWYDYTNKYTAAATEYLVPAPIGEGLARRLQEAALKAHRALGCRDVSRTDFRLDKDENFYLLEVNTIPGMTATSLLPKSAAAAGISFPQLCLVLVERALARGGSKS
jgi:D-alanine-D-alanine ligase